MGKISNRILKEKLDFFNKVSLFLKWKQKSAYFIKTDDKGNWGNPWTSLSAIDLYERDWLKFDRESVILDLFSVDWEDLFKIDELNADNSTRMYLETNILLDTYAPLRRINKCKLKFKSKPWIVTGL